MLFVIFLDQTPMFDWGGALMRINRPNIIKTQMHLQILLTTLHSFVNTINRTRVFNQRTNKHALPITISESKEDHFFYEASW